MLAALLVLTPAPGAATAQVTPGPGEQLTRWHLPFPTDGSKLPAVGRRARRLRIQFGVGVCNPSRPTSEQISRIVVERRAKGVIITVVTRPEVVPAYAICPAIAKLITRTVSLRGRLGRRSIGDGSFTPPRRVVKAPKR